MKSAFTFALLALSSASIGCVVSSGSPPAQVDPPAPVEPGPPVEPAPPVLDCPQSVLSLKGSLGDIAVDGKYCQSSGGHLRSGSAWQASYAFGDGGALRFFGANYESVPSRGVALLRMPKESSDPLAWYWAGSSELPRAPEGVLEGGFELSRISRIGACTEAAGADSLDWRLAPRGETSSVTAIIGGRKMAGTTTGYFCGGKVCELNFSFGGVEGRALVTLRDTPPENGSVAVDEAFVIMSQTGTALRGGCASPGGAYVATKTGEFPDDRSTTSVKLTGLQIATHTGVDGTGALSGSVQTRTPGSK